LALAAGGTIREACRKAKVSESTAYRRLEDPAFRKQVQNARAEVLSRAVGKLADTASAAVDTLKKLLKAKRENVRLAAARSILELGAKLRDAGELEERIRALEDVQAKGAKR
jgi:hypothetical protein